jgi:ribosomal-protein-alanine N-acetyltransferase
MAADAAEGLVIEPFKLGDIEALMEIENASFTLPWSQDSYEQLWPLESIEIWVARLQGELAGYYLTQRVAEEMELHTFAVKPTLRRRGIGRALMDHMISGARGRGVRFVFLQVRPSNEDARRLYERLGFVGVGTRKAYYRDNDEDAIVMRLAVA